ncbi:hypothetical protein P5868_003225 [Vibrio parahaemolyticus]|uniref:hypothetical protein n=1 Tax=Vibrio aestuarianus TaxID=28171 RepID=UPI0015942FC2|nr:hypothetical protein [Vibrio aestuarianus]EKQ5901122.1 hypothetical protein [Vibrio parahaemolyticus]NGZ19368.1 hypothetical protein [Vibrio aestuarianus]
MAKDRSRKKERNRRENTREERKVLAVRELVTFSFKDLDQTQPKANPQTINLWGELGLLPTLFRRLTEISKLTRDEACKQQQIKLYPGGFPEKDKTEFSVPSYVDENVAWGVIEGLGGKPRVAGYLSGNTFYIVFLDSEHKFWISKKSHT